MDIDSEVDLSVCENFAIENIQGFLNCVLHVKIPAPPECQPQGTYIKSCKNCVQDFCNLKCECNDGWRHKSTELDLLTCDSRVVVNNHVGVLHCDSPPEGKRRKVDKESKQKEQKRKCSPKKVGKTKEWILWIEKTAAFEEAQNAHADATKELINKLNSIIEMESFFEYDLGDDNILASLSDCLRVKIDKYTYEICPFDKVTQIEGKSSTDLGKFQEVKRLENGSIQMVFENGKSCWKGLKRSTTVDMICGSQEIIERVEEPETCVYRMQVTTPAACSNSKVKELKNTLNKLTGQFPNLLSLDIK
jgi:hypothetical protein